MILREDDVYVCFQVAGDQGKLRHMLCGNLYKAVGYWYCPELEGIYCGHY